MTAALFVFFAERLNLEIRVVADGHREAHTKAWRQLNDEQQCKCSCLDWIDTLPAPTDHPEVELIEWANP